MFIFQSHDCKSHVCERKCFAAFSTFHLFYVFYSKRDNELLLRLIANLNMLLRDESVNVVKKAILTLTQLYKVTLQVNPGLIYGTFSFIDFFFFIGINNKIKSLLPISVVFSHPLLFLLFLASGWCALKQYQRGRKHAGIWSHR